LQPKTRICFAIMLGFSHMSITFCV